jgi:hypothetical protein
VAMAGIAIAWEIAMMPAQFEASIAP